MARFASSISTPITASSRHFLAAKVAERIGCMDDIKALVKDVVTSRMTQKLAREQKVMWHAENLSQCVQDQGAAGGVCARQDPGAC